MTYVCAFRAFFLNLKQENDIYRLYSYQPIFTNFKQQFMRTNKLHMLLLAVLLVSSTGSFMPL